VTTPHMAAGSVDNGADERGPFASGRERERGVTSWAWRWATATTASLGWLAWEEEGRREGGSGLLWAERREGAGMSPSGFFISYFYFLTLLCICLNDFKFKCQCMGV
jgi:hypothetical protein